MNGERHIDLTVLPSVDAVLSDPRLSDLTGEPRPLVRSRVREILDSLRREIRGGIWMPKDRDEALVRITAEIRSGAREPLGDAPSARLECDGHSASYEPGPGGPPG